MNDISEIISWLEKKLESLRQKAQQIEQCIKSLKTVFADIKSPITMSEDHDQQIEKTIESPSMTESDSGKLRAERPQQDRSRISKYKGVTAGRTRTDGTKTWRAYVWREGSVKYLGSAYESEEAAAAAAAEARGDHAEARTLAAMGEQIENNPDRPAGGHWECNRCGAKRFTKDRPGKCDACGRRSFARISADGRG